MLLHLVCATYVVVRNHQNCKIHIFNWGFGSVSAHALGYRIKYTVWILIVVGNLYIAITQYLHHICNVHKYFILAVKIHLLEPQQD